MEPAEMIAPVFGIAAAAAVTFYTVSFLQMSDKSFEDIGENGADPLSLRSPPSNKEKRKKSRKEFKEQQSK